MLGISMYLHDLTNAEEKIKRYVKAGFRCMFSSLHFSSEDPSTCLKKLTRLGQIARDYQMSLTIDVTKEALEHIGFSFPDVHKIKDFGVSGLRIDDGISPAEIATLTKHMKVYVNASTLTAPFLADLHFHCADMEQMEAFHNYYPKPGTGLGETFFQNKNHFLKSQGLKISAFIPGDAEKRAPLYEGLPTLEKHRSTNTPAAFLELKAMGVDHVYVGDSALTENSLAFFQTFTQEDAVLLKGAYVSPAFYTLDEYFACGARNRIDEARDLIRLEQSRSLFAKRRFIRTEIVPRQIGDVTIDNEKYGRYQGEICIVKTPLPADEKTTLIAKIDQDFNDCLPFIKGGQKLKLQLRKL